MVELVDTLDLGSSVARRGGSSPLLGTSAETSLEITEFSVFSIIKLKMVKLYFHLLASKSMT